MAEPTSGADAPSRTAADWVADLCVYAPIGFFLDAHKYVPEFAEKGRSQVATARFVGKFAVGRLEKAIGPVLDGASGPLRSLLDGLGLLRVPPPAPGGGDGRTAVAGSGAIEIADTGVAFDAVDDGSDAGSASPAPATRAAASRRRSGSGTGTSGGSRSSSRRPSRSGSVPGGSGRGTSSRSTSTGRSGSSTTRSGRARPKPRTSADAGLIPGATADPGPVAVPVEAELAIPQYSTLAASQVVPRLASLDVHELAAIRRFESDHRGRRTILNRVDQLLARSD